MNGWASPPAPTWPPSWGPQAPARPLPPPTPSASRRMRRPPSPLGIPPPLRSSTMVAETFCMLMLLGEGEAALHQSRPAGGRRAGKGNWGSGWMGSRRSGAGPHIPGRGEGRSCSPVLWYLYMLVEMRLLSSTALPLTRCRLTLILPTFPGGEKSLLHLSSTLPLEPRGCPDLFRQRSAALTLCSELFLAYFNTGWMLWRDFEVP